MILKHLGLGCFWLKANETVLVLDPFNPKEVGLPLPPMEADMVYFSKPIGDLDEQTLSRVQTSQRRASLGKELLTISEPGEYEIGDILVQVHAQPEVVVINVDDVNLCYVSIGKKLAGEIDFEEIPTIDYLIVPVGDGELCLDWKKLDIVLREVEPGMVIPSCYHEKELKEPYSQLKKLEEFAEEFGTGEIKHEKKLKLQNVILGEEEKYGVTVLDAE